MQSYTFEKYKNADSITYSSWASEDMKKALIINCILHSKADTRIYESIYCIYANKLTCYVKKRKAQKEKEATA